MSDLESIGYSDWFKSRMDEGKSAAHGVARIVSVHKDSYTVTKGGDESPRVFRRLGCLSHAALDDSSSCR